MRSILNFFRAIFNAIINLFRNCVPKYEPAVWHAPDVILKNNCYNYACDIITNTFAQPGRASGNLFGVINCPDISDGANWDGLDGPFANMEPKCRGCCHQAALAVTSIDWRKKEKESFELPEDMQDLGLGDYHWYRKDRNGNWSHKMGSGRVTNRDNIGNIITDPKTASRGRYTIFCGYFCVCKAQVTIR